MIGSDKYRYISQALYLMDPFPTTIHGSCLMKAKKFDYLTLFFIAP